MAAWSRYALRPRAAVGRNVTRVDLSTTVLGRPVSIPLLLGAAGGHGIAHTRGEIATARAAATAGIVGGIAQRAKFPLSEIHAEAVQAAEGAGKPDPTLVWQLYAPRSPDGDEVDRDYCEKVRSPVLSPLRLPAVATSAHSVCTSRSSGMPASVVTTLWSSRWTRLSLAIASRPTTIRSGRSVCRPRWADSLPFTPRTKPV